MVLLPMLVASRRLLLLSGSMLLALGLRLLVSSPGLGGTQALPASEQTQTLSRLQTLSSPQTLS